MIIPTNAAEFWTMISAIATMAVVLIAGWGLNSLRLAKKDMITRAKRASVLLAMRRMDDFAHKIIPCHRKVLTRMKQEKIPVFVQSIEDVCFDTPVNKVELKRAFEWSAHIPDLGSVVSLMNEMEAWSGYFTNRLADEEVAYGPCAQTFCFFVMGHYACYLTMRGVNNSGNYPNTINLFLAWRQRLGEEEQGQAVEELLERLYSVQGQEEIGTGHTIPRPLGIDSD